MDSKSFVQLNMDYRWSIQQKLQNAKDAKKLCRTNASMSLSLFSAL